VLTSGILWWGLLCWACGMFVTLVLTPVVRSWSIRHHLLDRATQFHTTHTIAVPRLGGVSLVVSFVVIFVILVTLVVNSEASFRVPEEGWTMLATCAAMFGLGFWDDIRPLGAREKLIIQILIAWVAYLGGLRIGQFIDPFTRTIYVFEWLDLPLTILWLVGVTNLINLMDGIDGLAAGLTLLLMLLLSMMVLLPMLSGLGGNTFSLLLSVGMGGALCGFLFYNFPPAKIFMGDGGAYFLGLLIAELALLNSNKGEVAGALIVPFFALGLPIIDTCFTIFRRGLVGLPIFRADRKHIHHRLVGMGFSQQRVVVLLYAICVFFALLALCAFVSRGRWAPVILGVFMLVALLSARLFGYVQDWYKLGRVLTDSVIRRKHTRYALVLGELLLLEAERSGTLDDLWGHFGLVLQKLGFSRVILRSSRAARDSGATQRDWNLSAAISQPPSGERSMTQELRGNSPSEMLFFCNSQRWDEDTHRLLSELAAESWVRASARWQSMRQISR